MGLAPLCARSSGGGPDEGDDRRVVVLELVAVDQVVALGQPEGIEPALRPRSMLSVSEGARTGQRAGRPAGASTASLGSARILAANTSTDLSMLSTKPFSVSCGFANGDLSTTPKVAAQLAK